MNKKLSGKEWGLSSTIFKKSEDLSRTISQRNGAGFTLLEILLVVAAIGILAGIVIVAINPSKQLGDTRNAQRKADVNTLINAIYQYAIDNNGTLPAVIDSTPGTPQLLGTGASGATCTASTTVLAAAADLTSTLVPTYLVGIPQDPTSGTATSTSYYINKWANGRIIVGSCEPEQGKVIEVSR